MINAFSIKEINTEHTEGVRICDIDFSTTVERSMSGEGFASLDDLIFLIWLKIKNVLVVNRYKRSFDSDTIDRHQKKVVIAGHEASRTIELMKAFKSNCKNE